MQEHLLCTSVFRLGICKSWGPDINGLTARQDQKHLQIWKYIWWKNLIESERSKLTRRQGMKVHVGGGGRKAKLKYDYAANKNLIKESEFECRTDCTYLNFMESHHKSNDLFYFPLSFFYFLAEPLGCLLLTVFGALKSCFELLIFC